MSDPLLSIVIIGRNEGVRLSRCFESIARMHPLDGPVELIYVDSDSSDGSPQLAAHFGAQVIVIQGGKQTAARARNAGWHQARGEYVLFLDGDTVLEPDFPSVSIKAIDADRKTAVVWGHRREIQPRQSIYNQVLDLDWIYAPGETAFCGGDALIRRNALQETGGYDAALIAGEEPELCRRLRSRGYKILHIDSPMTKHDLSITRFSQYWKHALRAGFAYAEISSRFRKSSDPLWRNESRANIVRGSFWILSLFVGVLLAVYSIWPLTAWMVMLVLLAARSAWKVRWKSPDTPVLLFLFGIHSHLQQVPVFMGQLRYYWKRSRGKEQKLIEYKAGTS